MIKSTQHGDSTSALIGIVGAKGGVGASTIALNTAVAAAKDKANAVLLIDFDLHCPGDLESMLEGNWKTLRDVDRMRGQSVPSSLIRGYLTRDGSDVACVRAADFQDGDGAEHLAPDRIAEILNYLSEAFELIIVDCGTVFSTAHSPVLIGAGKILIVTEGRVDCLGHARRKYELCARAYIPAEKIQFVINRWSDEQRIPRSLIAEKLPKDPSYFLNHDVPGMEKAYEKAGSAVSHASKGTFVKSLYACIDKGLLDAPRRVFPLADASTANAFNVIERWIKTLVPEKDEPMRDETSTQHDTRMAAKPQIRDRAADEAWRALKQNIIGELFKAVDLKTLSTSAKGDGDKLTKSTTTAILKIINDIGEDTVPQGKRKQLVEEVLHEALGLGPLEVLMADRTVSEIMVNGKDQIYVEREGKLSLSPMTFSSDEQLYRIIERIVSPIGRRVDESTPLVDARLIDGSRVNIIIPPLALKGPTVTIRRFSETPYGVNDLIRFGALTKDMATFLQACIEAKLNIIVSGGTGSGKTTLLNALSSYIPEDDRIVTIEDAAELKLHQPHIVTLESRPANLEGKGTIDIRDLVRNALRMRPDRIVVGECRGGEALDMLQAMNTGHDGSMTTVHANSAKDAISRLETLVLFSGIDLPSRAIREQITGGIHMIIQLSRFSDGTRKISDIAEITGMEGAVVTLQSIYQFRQSGIDENRRVRGRFEPTGVVPKFFDELQQKGTNLSRDIFIGDATS